MIMESASQPVEHELLTIGEAAKMLRMSKSSLYKLIRQGRIGYVDVPGAKLMVHRTQILEMIESAKHDPSSQTG